MIPLLEPLFQGELAALGETLSCGELVPEGAIKVADLAADTSRLTGVLRRHARHWRCADLRPVASAWSLGYLWALLPPVLAATSVLQHGLPTQADRMWISLGEDGLPLRFHITHEGQPLTGSDTARRHDALLWQHLQPLFAGLSQASRLPLKILWGNAARHMGTVLEQAMLLTDQAPHIAEDLRRLLHSPDWSVGQRNPLHAHRREFVHVDGGRPERRTLHQQCCLYYRLPGEGYCVACPLSPHTTPLSD